MSSDLLSDYWRRQGLDRAETDPASIVATAAGLYGTAPTCYLSLIARCAGFGLADLDEALYESRTLVRVRAVRGSLYMVPRSLLPAVISSGRAKAVGGFKSLFREQLGEQEAARWEGRILDSVAAGSRSAAEIRAMLAPPPPVAENLKYLIALMAVEGKLVRASVQGGWRSDRFTYARTEDWLGEPIEPIPEAEADAIVARWYLQGHGPATLADLRWWSGLTARRAKAALEALPDRVVDGEWHDLAGAQVDPGQPDGVRLLPVWDTSLIGHRDRSRIMPDELVDWVYDSSGNATSVVMQDGVPAARWQLDGYEDLAVKVAPLPGCSPLLWRDIDDEAETVRAALGADSVQVVRCDPGDPLRVAPRNRFLSPLRDC